MRNWAFKKWQNKSKHPYRAQHSSCWINVWLTIFQYLPYLKIYISIFQYLQYFSIFPVLRFVENWVCSHRRHTVKPKPTFMPSQFPRMSYICVLFHSFIQLLIHFSIWQWEWTSHSANSYVCWSTGSVTTQVHSGCTCQYNIGNDGECTLQNCVAMGLKPEILWNPFSHLGTRTRSPLLIKS